MEKNNKIILEFRGQYAVLSGTLEVVYAKNSYINVAGRYGSAGIPDR